MADDSEDIFDDMFGTKTPEDREDRERQWNNERNERARISFETERDRRAEFVAMDARIRRIAGEEINKVFLMLVFVGAIYWAGNEYGVTGGIGVTIVGLAVFMWESRKADTRPRKCVEESDGLAEDTVTHQRIVSYEREGKPWLWTKGKYIHWEGFFDYPYWDDVNKQVREYVKMSHKDRLAHNKTARAASLPYRLAMEDRLKQQGKENDEDWGLPYHAQIERNERSGK